MGPSDEPTAGVRTGGGRVRGLVLALVLAGGLGILAARGLRPEPEPGGPGAVVVGPRPGAAANSDRRLVGPPGEVGDQGPGEEELWVRQNNEALEELGAGRLARAVELLEGCHAAVPQSDVFRLNLAEALTRLAEREHDEGGDPQQAIRHLARAVELAPERSRLAELLEHWQREAELARGDQLRPGVYFDLSFDSGRRDLLAANQDILDFLEGGGGRVGAYEGLREWFRVDPLLENGHRFRVVVYDRAEFDHLTGLGDWAGGVFDGVIRIAVEDLALERSRWERVLMHELVHAFVREVGGRDVPGWLTEGLAQWHEGGVRVDRARDRLAGGELFPLERLQGSLATWTDTDAIARAYAQSLVLVDHVIATYGPETVHRMLAGCREGGSAAAAFERWNGLGLDVVLSDLREGL